MSMFIYLVMAFWAGHRPRLQHPAVGHDGAGAGADRRADGLPLAVDRRPVGQADVGHLVGVGCAADLGTDPVLPLHRLHRAAGGHRRSRAAPTRPAAILALVGVVNIPIIYFSVKWWNTLHQGSSVNLTKSPSMAADHALGHAADGAVLLDVLDRRRLDARAHHHARTRAHTPTGSRHCWPEAKK